MLAGGRGYPLGAGNVQRADQPAAGFLRLDDGVDIAPPGGLERAGKEFFVLIDQLRATGCGVGMIGQLSAIEKANGGFGTHDGDLGGDRKSTRLNSSHVKISYA